MLLPALRQAANGLDLSAHRIWAGGCGDSAFAAGAATGMFAASGIDYRPATAQELAFHTSLGSEDLVVLMSISGGTRRTVQAARRARAAGTRTLAVTCNPDSALAEACHLTLVLPFQPLSRRTPHTAEYLATLLALAVLAETRGGQRDDGLDRLPDVIGEVIAATDAPAAELVGSLGVAAKIFVLGQGANLATAHYIAAKFHESGGLTALAGETENFVHGMNFMIEPEDLVCVIGDDGPGAFRAAELLPGLAQLCRHVAAIGAVGDVSADATRLGGVSVPPALTVFPAAVVGQLLCLAVVEKIRLAVEEPRAGRPRAALHAKIQHTWITRTDDTLP